MLCLNKNNFIKQYEVKYLCAKCSREIHNISICEKDKQVKRDNKETPQTANVDANPDENLKNFKRIIFGPYSRCTGVLQKTLNLKTVTKQTIVMRRFVSIEAITKIYDIVQTRRKGKPKYLKIEVCCIPFNVSEYPFQQNKNILRKHESAAIYIFL